MLRRLCHWMLVLSLVLSGIGSAMASVAVHAMPSQDAVPMQADAPSHHADHGTPAADAATPDAGCDDDCCDGPGLCLCPCQYLVQDTTFAPMLVAVRLPQAPAFSRPLPGRPAPALREDTRPPIGQA